MDAKSILAEEVQSIVTVKCFFAHQSPMIRPMIRVLGLAVCLGGILWLR